MRVGGKEEIEVNVRLVSATHRNLPAMVRDGAFREDLFHRLNVIQLRTPALREHSEDIGKIANAFWFQRHRQRLESAQIAALKSYDYLGNVRELFNLLERADVLGLTDFAALIADHIAMNSPPAEGCQQGGVVFPDNLDEAIARHIRRVYEKYGDNLARTAKALGASPNTVRKYLDAGRRTQDGFGRRTSDN